MKEKQSSVWSLRTIVIAGLWVLFILLLLQLPKFHNQMLTDFNPYDLLKIERGADLRTVKRAFHKMSLKWHPDKHKDIYAKEKAEQMFILINKAYQTLTDEKTRKNYQEYGNPDGYQGQSVTIGLPSFLTNKRNELIVLLAYFASMVVLCVVVGTWWNWSTRFHKSGVLNESNFLFWNRLKPKLHIRACIEVFSGSDEFRELEIMFDNLPEADKEEMKKLQKMAMSNWKTQDDANYSKYAATLLYCHLKGIELPLCLKPMMNYFLKETPKLLDVMIDMTLQRQFVHTGIALIDLKQRVVQGRQIQDKPVQQLPYYTDKWDSALKTSKIRTLKDFLRKKDEEVDNILGNNNTENPLLENKEERRNFILGLRMFPYVHVRYCARTYDEDEIYLNDMITITINVERIEDKVWEVDLNYDPVMEPPEKKNATGDRRDYEDGDGLSFVDSNIEKHRRLKIKEYNSP
eukprot:UN33824